MVSNPDLVLYSCIARGTVILAEFSRESSLDDLALRCIQKAPPHHSTFSHTVRKRLYTFLIQGPFVYFGIFHEDLYKSEVSGFLHRLSRVFEEFIESESLDGFENFTSHCFQSQFDSTFRHLLGLNLSKTSANGDQRSSLDAGRRKKTSLISKFSNPGTLMMKKKKKVVGDGNGNGNGEGKYPTAMDDSPDLYDDNNGLCSRDITLLMQKNGSQIVERQKAKQVWRKHVVIVLSIDLFVCMVLFAIWLWVCRGFQCIEA